MGNQTERIVELPTGHWVRFLHVADIHLDSPLKGLRSYPGAPKELVQHATRSALGRMVDLAIAERVDFVVVAGDLYDGSWPDQSTGLYFSQQMSRLRHEEIPVFIIRGNHDAASRVTEKLELPENVFLLAPGLVTTVAHPILEQRRVKVHGHSYADAAVIDSVMDMFPRAAEDYFNLGVLHTAMEGDQQHQRYAPCSLDDLRSKGYDYWALGHVHQRRLVCQEPMVVFPGNIQGRHIRETGAKGCYLVEVDRQKQSRLTFHALDVLRWVHWELDVSHVDDPLELQRQIRLQFEREWDLAWSADDTTVVSPGGANELTEQVVHQPEALAIRLTIKVGREVYASVRRQLDQLTLDLRSMLTDLSKSRGWLEKVQLPVPATVPTFGDSAGPRELLEQLVGNAAEDFELKVRLRGPISDLLKKMPTEIGERLGQLNSDDQQLAERIASLPQLIDAIPPHRDQ